MVFIHLYQLCIQVVSESTNLSPILVVVVPVLHKLFHSFLILLKINSIGATPLEGVVNLVDIVGWDISRYIEDFTFDELEESCEEIATLFCDDLFRGDYAGSDSFCWALQDKRQCITELMISLMKSEGTVLRLLDDMNFEIISALVASLQDELTLIVQECYIMDRHYNFNYFYK